MGCSCVPHDKQMKRTVIVESRNRWWRWLSAVVGLLILGGVAYCTSLYATAESRVSGVCAKLTAGMDFDAVARIAAANGMNTPQRALTSYVVESATFGRYGCKLQFEDGVLRSSTYEFQD